MDKSFSVIYWSVMDQQNLPGFMSYEHTEPKRRRAIMVSALMCCCVHCLRARKILAFLSRKAKPSPGGIVLFLIAVNDFPQR